MTTVEEYLEKLPPERRAVVSAVRDVVAKNMPKGYRESLEWGMISWEVPLERYPDTYNGRPLLYVALAAQKNHYAVYLTSAYQDAAEAERLAQEFAKAGKKLDIGKSCIRFKKLEDLPLDVIGRAVKRTPVAKFIAQYESVKRK